MTKLAKNIEYLPGRKGLEDLLSRGDRCPNFVILRKGAKLSDRLRDLLDSKKIAVKNLDDDKFFDLPGSEQAQGVLAAFEQRAWSLEEMVERLQAGYGPIVICDQVLDPHNLGAILRAAEAFRSAGVICSVDRSAPLTPVVRKSSAGASEIIPIHFATNLQRAITVLKKSRIWIVGTALSPAAKRLGSYQVDSLSAIVLGNEGDGLRRLTQDLCDELIYIPIEGKVESLNVSQAAAVVLFEFSRQTIVKDQAGVDE